MHWYVFQAIMLAWGIMESTSGEFYTSFFENSRQMGLRFGEKLSVDFEPQQMAAIVLREEMAAFYILACYFHYIRVSNHLPLQSFRFKPVRLVRGIRCKFLNRQRRGFQKTRKLRIELFGGGIHAELDVNMTSV